MKSIAMLTIFERIQNFNRDLLQDKVSTPEIKMREWTITHDKKVDHKKDKNS